MKQNSKIGMSVALASLLALGLTGCGDSSDDTISGVVSSAVDVVVERGKIYDANVTDSSSPAKVATQKNGQNIYTFANTPTYPIVVNGGWIDVNDDGMMDASDVKLDIEMRSYGTTVTPLTTFIADTNETVRENKLNDLVARLNASGVGTDIEVTAQDLLKVPSDAPRDVFVTANAIYKDMKENGDVLPDEDAVLSQFGTIDTLGAEATAKDFEVQVVGDLVMGGDVEKVSSQDIFEFEQEQSGAVVPTLAQALLLNNITGLSFLDGYIFNDDYTLTDGTWTHRWSVNSTELIVTLQEGGDSFRYQFIHETPVDGESITEEMFYMDENNQRIILDSTSSVIGVAPVEVSTPTTPGNSLPDLSGYSSIVIYKNIAETTANNLLTVMSGHSGFGSKISSTQSASCSDFGFTSVYSDIDGSAYSPHATIYSADSGFNTCVEYDYAGVVGSGSSNVLAYYGL
ncbi:MAG: hypothetical protein U9O86_02360 [Campylobacterota bacterium]|nr:hypothetical protein [Campylobacterota bacterium]